MGTFLLIVALFGSFGYSGNFGIVTGMVCSGSAMYCFAVHFMGFVGGKRPCLNEEERRWREEGGGGGGNTVLNQ